MKLRAGTIRTLTLLTGLALCASPGARGQSLGDVAREARKERVAAAVAGKNVPDSDDDGPDSAGVWRIRMCGGTPCFELSITLPKSPKWARAEAPPRPVVIPLLGPEDDANRVIRVYSAPSLDPYYSVDAAKRTFLQSWFARPEYFGRQARIVLDEHVQIGGHAATIIHFSVSNGVLKYRGLSVVANSPNGNSGFACVFRDQDAGAATSICDAIVRSANDQSLADSTRKVYPTDVNPAGYDPRDDDPTDDPPEDDDPQ